MKLRRRTKDVKLTFLEMECEDGYTETLYNREKKKFYVAKMSEKKGGGFTRMYVCIGNM